MNKTINTGSVCMLSCTQTYINPHARTHTHTHTHNLNNNTSSILNVRYRLSTNTTQRPSNLNPQQHCSDNLKSL